MNPNKNKALIERYPFLLPRDWKTDQIPEAYDYSYTMLDDMPDGWRKAFGEELCEAIREELIKAGLLDQYRVIQIKEKYGELVWYDSHGNDTIRRSILRQYTQRSRHVCLECGQPATKRSVGWWIAPWCDTCAKGLPHERFVPISELQLPTK